MANRLTKRTIARWNALTKDVQVDRGTSITLVEKFDLEYYVDGQLVAIMLPPGTYVTINSAMPINRGPSITLGTFTDPTDRRLGNIRSNGLLVWSGV